MTTITKDGEYTTRNGLPVRIYATDGGGYYPVHGAIFSKDTWESAKWTADGKDIINLQQRPLDLIPKPKTRKLDVWVNVWKYDDGSIVTGSSHISKEAADRNCGGSTDRFACIHIEREITEGEGLS